METISTPALLARRVDYRDADLICTLLTRARGKLSAMARGARRSRKRFGGALGLFVVGEATLRSPARGGELHLLERFDSVEDLAGPISADVIKVAHGSYLLELARELWPTAQAEPAGFDLLCETLRVLAARPPAPMLLRAFELQFLQVSGLAPLVDRCVSCGGEPGGELRFDLARGGVTCAECGGEGVPLAGPVHQLLLQLRSSPPREAAALTCDAESARSLRELMVRLTRHALGKELRSLEFIMQLGGWPSEPGA